MSLSIWKRYASAACADCLSKRSKNIKSATCPAQSGQDPEVAVPEVPRKVVKKCPSKNSKGKCSPQT